MSDLIPEAVLVDILAKLSIEDLLRCILVCRAWYSLITSPDFVSLRRKNDLLLVLDSNGFDSYAPTKHHNYSIHLQYKKDTFSLYKTLDFPFPSWGGKRQLRVIGCLNGVVCLSEDRMDITNVITLWNPSIRKTLTLPQPLVTFPSYGPHTKSIGFGFDSATNDYKVVRVVYLRHPKVVLPPKVEVYEVSVGSWRFVDPKGFSYVIPDRASQGFLNGAVHWTGSDCSEANTEFLKFIVSFDFMTEIFAVMKMPDSVTHGRQRILSDSVCVSVLGESLALIYNDLSSHSCCVWVMKQYGVTDSWTKLFNIDLTGVLSRVCGLLNNGDALVIVNRPERPNRRLIKSLVSYEPNSKQMSFIGDIRKEYSICVDYFEETFALLGVKTESTEPLESENTVVSRRSLDVHVKKKRQLQK